MSFIPRIGIRTLLPNATVKTIYFTSDGLGTAVSQAFTCNNGAPSPTNVEKAAGTNFAATAAGCMLRCVTAVQAANVGLSRKVTVRNGNDQLTVNAFPAVMTATDTFVLERVITQAVRRVAVTVETGGHCHVSFNKGAALVTDPLADDTMIKRFEIAEGAAEVNLLTDSDVSTIYVNVEGE
jgi:hypothetical protein